jgi:hypothetical protein
LGFRPSERRAYHHGETVTLVVRVRNVGKEAVQFQYVRNFFIENPPVVTNDMGKRIPLKDGTPKGIYKPVDVSLAPATEIELYELHLELRNNNDIGAPRDSTLYGTGKFSVQYERVLGSSSLSSVAIKFDPALSKLATGKLELETKEAAIVPGKKGSDKKEAFTAWGKEGAIHLPPLRERGEDLPLLVRHYLRRFSRELEREVQEAAPEALERLRGHSWPGNIRELQSVLKQSLLQARGPVLLPDAQQGHRRFRLAGKTINRSPSLCRVGTRQVIPGGLALGLRQLPDNARQSREADACQQRRDLVRGAAHRQPGRGVVPLTWYRGQCGDQDFHGERMCQPPL